MPTDLPPRRSEGYEMGQKLGALVGFGMFLMIGLGCVWLIAYTIARAVKSALGL